MSTQRGEGYDYAAEAALFADAMLEAEGRRANPPDPWWITASAGPTNANVAYLLGLIARAISDGKRVAG